MTTISESDFKGVDLNLLVTFLVLMRERSVSAAAQKLFLGQPAVSGALGRLREMFGDALFIRTAEGMVPTTRALEIARTLEPALETVRGVLTRSTSFNPLTDERTFTVGMPDWVEMWLMPELLSRLGEVAPHVRVAVKATDRMQDTRMLESDEMDLGVSVTARGPTWRRSVDLARMNYSCVFSADQVQISGALTLAGYLRFPHLFISHQGDFDGIVDARLAELGKQRKVIYSTSQFATLPHFLERLPSFATVPQLLALRWQKQYGLRVAAVPLTMPVFTVSMLWHAKRDSDGALAWMRSTVEAAVAATTTKQAGQRVARH